jgi:hypothetical protein
LAPHVGGIGRGREKENTGNIKQHGGIRKNEDEGEVRLKEREELWMEHVFRSYI